MKFVARHISFQELENVPGGWMFALGDLPGLPGEDMPETYVMIQFGDEDEQDRRLGMTGLHIETSDGELEGYGKVAHIAYDGETVSITGRYGAGRIEARIATDMMTPGEIYLAIQKCNGANMVQPEE